MTALPRPPTSRRAGRTAGYAAWIWVVVFIAAHIYWYLGGRIGHPSTLPAASLDAFTVVVAALFILGAIVPLASVHGWGRVIPRWMLLGALWAGCAILILRGGAGLVDEVLRVTDLSSTGLTGLTRKEVTGSAHPSAYILWSGRATDAFFVLGGVLSGFAARVPALGARGRRLGLALAMGIAFGVVSDKIAFGVGVGLALGIAVGLAVSPLLCRNRKFNRFTP